MNREILSLALVSMIGAGLGTFYFYGLWWTIKKGLSAKFSAPWFLTSLLFRTAITLTGFYLIIVSSPDGELKRLLFCLLGFLTVRLSVTRVSRLGEVTHASES